MTKKSFASLFTGFGLADVGAKLAGCELAWGIEPGESIADVSRQLGHKIWCESVIDTNWSKLEKVDILLAAPPCPNFSANKKNATETKLDIQLAKSIAEAITTLLPQSFILENVEGYKRSRSLELIESVLYSLGYWIDRQVLNAADFGIPQTRRRLIVRAVRGSFVPPLFGAKQWVGWYQPIEDLIPGLPESQLAQWQLKRLPQPLVTCLFQAGNPNGNRIEKFRRVDYPAPTVCASEPLTKAVLSSGKVVQMSPRCLARFQTLPDWYELPSNKRLACRGIGNGLPCKLAESIVQTVL